MFIVITVNNQFGLHTRKESEATLKNSAQNNKRNNMILVTGATGKLGQAVIHQLLKNTSANNIAALVRVESKAADLKDLGVNIRMSWTPRKKLGFKASLTPVAP
jgi:FlaA1/EpsC-like NDP-sugar epimerase